MPTMGKDEEEQDVNLPTERKEESNIEESKNELEVINKLIDAEAELEKLADFIYFKKNLGVKKDLLPPLELQIQMERGQ